MIQELYPSLSTEDIKRLTPVLCDFNIEIPKEVKQNIFDIVTEFLNFKKSQFNNWSDSVLNSLDFHYSSNELKIIEANTNASGYLVCNLLLKSKDEALDFEKTILESFFHVFESRNPNPLYIMDENPEGEKMFSEFLMFKDMFLRNGIQNIQILKTSELPLDKKSFVYNRDTDFYFEKRPEIVGSIKNGTIKCSTSPETFERLASKKNDLNITSTENYPNLNAALLKSVVFSKDLWATRKKYFFKPQEMFGGKGVYSGKSLSRKKFDSLDENYLAQETHPPGKVKNGEEEWKYDIRAFFSESGVQKVVARVYQGQLTNFSNDGGGFAVIHWV